MCVVSRLPFVETLARSRDAGWGSDTLGLMSSGRNVAVPAALRLCPVPAAAGSRVSPNAVPSLAARDGFDP